MTPMKTMEEEAREERFNAFVKEFVNSHGQNWRPLRGLWPEDVAEFWEKHIALAHKEERERILEIVEGNYKGSFTDDAGHDCWYIDELANQIRK